MNRPTHFEIPAENPEKSIAFYQKLFGWQFHKWDGPMEYWMIMTGEGNGINGGLMKRNDPAQPCTNVVEVADVEASLKTAAEAGGTVVVPKMPIPGIGWLGYCKDPDGHIFGMMQNDPSAQ